MVDSRLSASGRLEPVLDVHYRCALRPGRVDGDYQAVHTGICACDDWLLRRAAHDGRDPGRRPVDDQRRGRGIGCGDCGRFFRNPRVVYAVVLMAAYATRDAEVLERRSADDAPAVVFKNVSLSFDDKPVLRDVSFTLLPGHTKIILGASGSGKSTILKLILGLLKPDGGEIWIHGSRVDRMPEAEMMKVRGHLGMVFQEGALFDSLTVAENVGYKLYAETDMPLEDVRRRVEEVLGFIGLAEHIDKMPSELSGGQRRRVAIARAMAFKPKILLYDEATTGLDPITATTVDDEIIKLRDLEGVSSIVVTHQLRDAFYVATHMAVRNADGSVEIKAATPAKEREAEFIMLRDGVICFEGDADALRASTDSYLREFLT